MPHLFSLKGPKFCVRPSWTNFRPTPVAFPDGRARGNAARHVKIHCWGNTCFCKARICRTTTLALADQNISKRPSDPGGQLSQTRRRRQMRHRNGDLGAANWGEGERSNREHRHLTEKPSEARVIPLPWDESCVQDPVQGPSKRKAPEKERERERERGCRRR